MAATDDSQLLTVREAAEFLRVSRMTHHRWLKEGRLRSYRVGPRAIRIRRRDLEMIVTPARNAGFSGMRPENSTDHSMIHPLTEEEKRQGEAALAASPALIAQMRARRGGQQLAESWPLIREARAERSSQQV